MKFVPFANEHDTFRIGNITIENRVDRVSIYGSTDLTLDLEGLNKAIKLLDFLQSVIDEMGKDKLSEHIEIVSPVKGVSPL